MSERVWGKEEEGGDGCVAYIYIMDLGKMAGEGRRAVRAEEWDCLRGADGVVVDKERCAAEGNRGKGRSIEVAHRTWRPGTAVL